MAQFDSAGGDLREIEAGDSKHQCPVEREVANGMIILDIDCEGRLIGIEVIGAQDGLPPELFVSAPN